MSKFYLAGPITGYPDGNKPMFDRVSATLRKQGYDVVSPLDFDSAGQLADTLNRPYKDTYWDVLSRDVKLISTLDGIIFLPGWEKSTGAKLEATVGLVRKMKFMRWDDNGNYAVPYARTSVACALHQEFMQNV